MLPRSGRVDGGVDHARAALALGEPRAAPVRSGWAEATQRGRGNGGKVVRKRGRGMKICRVKYYVDFGGFLSKKEPTRRCGGTTSSTKIQTICWVLVLGFVDVRLYPGEAEG